MSKYLLCILLSFTFPKVYTQTTWYVKSNAMGAQTGNSWSTAFASLTPALQNAKPGDQIWVAGGNYYATTTGDRTAFFDLKSGVQLFGGFSGTETTLVQRNWQINKSILNGDIGVPGDSTDNTRNLMRLIGPSNSTIVDGFVFKNAVADAQNTDYGAIGAGGAAMFIDGTVGNAYPTIKNCTFQNNTALGWGGAILIRAGDTGQVAPSIIDCNFEWNRAYHGAAVFRQGSSNLEVARDFQGCRFYKNIAREKGAAIYFSDSNNKKDTLDVIACDFIENEALSPLFVPAGVFYTSGRSNGSSLRFVQCSFVRNLSKAGSGIVFDSEDNPMKYILVDSCFFDHNYSFEVNAPIDAIAINLYSGYFNPAFKSYLKIQRSTFMHHDVGMVYLIAPPFNKVIFNENNINDNPTKLVLGLFDSDTIECSSNIFVNNGNSFGFTPRKSFACINNLIYGPGIGINTDYLKNTGIIANNLFNGTNHYSACIFSGNLNIIGNVFINNSFTFPINNNFPSPFAPSYVSNNIFLNNRNTITTPNAKYYQFLPFYQDSATFTHNIFDFASCDTLGKNITCGEGNLFNVDPMFYDTAALDFRLQACSPAIQAGTNIPVNNLNIATDFSGNPRIQDGIVDIGPIESLSLVQAASPTITPACLNTPNGAVDFSIEQACEPLSYFWTSGLNTGTNLFGLKPGSYAFTITDQKGKLFTDTLTIGQSIAPQIEDSIQAAQCANCPNGAITLTITNPASYTYLWSNGWMGQNLGQVLPGTYILTLTDGNGCTSSFSYVVPFISGTIQTSASLPVQVSPNPFSSTLRINLPAQVGSIPHFVLYDLFGREVYATDLQSFTTDIHLAHAPAGVYTWRMDMRGMAVQSGKVVKME
ncbi:MAG: T9SS type A sorting domain-containing protein [Bacteroidetes bacterium]|nr:T9SS type A sorting domain-containing protein [Bacteroidota bacterium]